MWGKLRSAPSAILSTLDSNSPNFLHEIVARTQADPAFQSLNARFLTAGVQNWLKESEKALHFGVGAFAAGHGISVELGSFEGGSAIFMAGGMKRRGSGRLFSVDPHLGGPPWLGMAPHQRTLQKFQRNAEYCGVQDQIESCLGDSAAVAAVWPAEPIDSVFIDADHSFLGALKDFECWAPKLRTGGLVLIDDADDPCLPELLDLIEHLKTIPGVTHLGTLEGVAVFRRDALPAREMLAGLSEANARRSLYRPWDLQKLHAMNLPGGYFRSWHNAEPGSADSYQLCYLAKCGPGAYGYSPHAAENDIALIRAVSADRGDGPAVDLEENPTAMCRAIICLPEEAAVFAHQLLPGGVLLSRNTGTLSQVETLAVRQMMIDAGLEGCGWGGALHWGVWKPFHLAPEAVLDFTFTGYQSAA